MDRAKTLELARDLEVFRSFVMRTMGGETVESSVPTTILAFGSSSAFAPFTIGRGVIGYFTPGMRRNRIVFKPYSSTAETSTLKHEYVHFILRNGRFSYPAWYDEGFAEFLATAHVDKGQIVVGMAPEWRFRRSFVDWIPLGRLMSSSPVRHVGGGRSENFYGQCWALVHYLHFGRGGGRVSSDLHRYLVETSRGASPEEAVQSAFGVYMDELDREVKKYYTRGRFQYMSAGLEGLGDVSDPEISPAPADRMALELGGLALAVEKPGLARDYFASVDAASPHHARALSGLGAAEHALGNQEEAEAAFQAALAAAPQDAYVHLDYARHLHDLAERRWQGRGKRESRRLASARKHYVKSWKLDESIPETYAMYGASFLLEGENPEKAAKTIEHAHRLLPSNLEIQLLLARAYAAIEKPDRARELALAVQGWTHDPDQRDEATELLQQLESKTEARSGDGP
jgi:tetratricopeptide (TPR) repeat protein